MEERNTVLSVEQQEQLNKKKVELRVANEKYLRDHPEVKDLMNGFVKAVLNKNPTNLVDFAGEYFTDVESRRSELSRD